MLKRSWGVPGRDRVSGRECQGRGREAEGQKGCFWQRGSENGKERGEGGTAAGESKGGQDLGRGWVRGDYKHPGHQWPSGGGSLHRPTPPLTHCRTASEGGKGGDVPKKVNKCMR